MIVIHIKKIFHRDLIILYLFCNNKIFFPFIKHKIMGLIFNISEL
jgi:hypothetical protein